MYKIKNLISLILVLAICFSFVVPIGATELTDASGTAQTPVVLTTEAAIFKVTVPTSLPVDVAADGSVQVAEKATIINLSAGAVKVTNVAIEAANSWELVDYQIDTDEFKVNDKKIGLQLNSADEMTNADGVFTFDATKWDRLDATGGTADKYDFTYNVVVAPQSNAIDGATVANVVFTIEWDKYVSTDPKPGLYETDSNYTILLKSWADLVADGDITVDGTTITSAGSLAGDLLIPRNITTLGQGCFFNRQDLTAVVFEENSKLTSVEAIAFGYNPTLKTVILPAGVNSIGSGAFVSTNYLVNVNIPDGVTSIESETFSSSFTFSSITIPSSVTNIGWYAFGGCRSLTDIYFDGTVDQWNAITKDSTWNQDCYEITVTCTNGTVIISENAYPYN